MNLQWFKSVINMEFVPGTKSYVSLSDDSIRKYLDEKAAVSKDVVTINTLDKIVKTNFQINMFDMDVRSWIENLFIFYK